MKHKHYDMIVAKAANTRLVKFVKLLSGWVVTTTDEWNVTSDYFLCLPQHKEACLRWLNGGEIQCNAGKDWFDMSDACDWAWSSCNNTMNPDYKFRIKPRKEKRWIVLQHDRELNDWCVEDGTLYKSLDEAEENRRYGMISEIEIEV